MSDAPTPTVIGLLHEQLPAVLAQDPNLVRFVALVDDTATELYERVGRKELMLDPATAPESMIDWLTDLLGLPLERDLAIELRRAVVMTASEWFPRRGTVESLRRVVGALVGEHGDGVEDEAPPVVIEESGWIRCRPEPEEPPVASDTPSPISSIPTPAVRFVVRPAAGVSRDDICALIERELRADVPYTVQLAATAPEEGTR